MAWSNVLLMAAISFGVFFLVAIFMAVGVMMGRKPISGSCGGLGAKQGEDGKTSCSLCENPAEACKELQRRQLGKEHRTAEPAGMHER